jgi:hypothetical protein
VLAKKFDQISHGSRPGWARWNGSWRQPGPDQPQ